MPLKQGVREGCGDTESETCRFALGKNPQRGSPPPSQRGYRLKSTSGSCKVRYNHKEATCMLVHNTFHIDMSPDALFMGLIYEGMEKEEGPLGIKPPLPPSPDLSLF